MLSEKASPSNTSRQSCALFVSGPLLGASCGSALGRRGKLAASAAAAWRVTCGELRAVRALEVRAVAAMTTNGSYGEGDSNGPPPSTAWAQDRAGLMDFCSSAMNL